MIFTTGSAQDGFIPITPSGYGYFTYSRDPIQLHYKDRIVENTDHLFLAGQIENEQPYITFQGEIFHVGLELYPLTPYYLFDVPGLNLVDKVLQGNLIEPFLGMDLAQRLNKLSTPQEVSIEMQKELLKIPPVGEGLDLLEVALETIYSRRGNINTDELINDGSMSLRHFRRLFTEIVGISPKKYCKVIQFNSTFNAICEENPEEIYKMALDNGYYDHSHFINDFKKYIGTSPGKFLKSDHSFLKTYLCQEVGQ